MNKTESIKVSIISEKNKKISAITNCDEAFTKSVKNREDFDKLFQKIDTYADFIVATIEDHPIGYAALYANNLESKEAFITLIGVDKCYQGNHIGASLIENCIDISKQRGMRTIRLEVLDVDSGAQSFYKKQGFVDDGRCSEQSKYMKMYL